MSEEPRDGITERQAEARRQNGKQSHGPVGKEGKRRSSRNATTHGVYTQKLYLIDHGPLRESSEELNAFMSGYIQELNPGNNMILVHMALDVGDKAWKLTRAQRWEVVGYSRPGSQNDLADQADMLLVVARRDRKAAAVLRNLPDSSIPSDELWGPFGRLAFHFGASEKSLAPLEDADAPTVMKVLLSLIARHFEDTVDAAVLLESMAEESEKEADGLYAAVRPGVVRQELDGAFSRNVERLVTHASRELDRSLKRYWQLWERMQTTQPPAQASSTPDQPVGHDNPPFENPVVPSHPEPDMPVPDNARMTPPSPGDPAPDLNLISHLLDRRLKSTASKPNENQTIKDPEDDS